jgi:hypothetical protein
VSEYELISKMKKMTFLNIIESNGNLNNDYRKKPIFPRIITCSQNFTMAGKSKRMAFSPGQLNHQFMERSATFMALLY